MLNIVKIFKFKVGGHLRIPKNKNTFKKGYTENWCEEVLVMKDIKNTLSMTCNINDIDNKIIETFYEKEFQKTC